MGESFEDIYDRQASLGKQCTKPQPEEAAFCTRGTGHQGPCAVYYRSENSVLHPRHGDKPILWLNDGYHPAKPEKSGGDVNYYVVKVVRPNKAKAAYTAECSDIIESLGMTFNEGEAFKAIWRKAAARTLGKLKEGGDARYDAQKVAHYGKRMLAQYEPPLEDSNG